MATRSWSINTYDANPDVSGHRWSLGIDMLLTTLIAIGVAHALYLTVLAGAKKNKGWPDYILTAYLATLAVTFATTFFAFAYAVPDLMILQLNISLLLAPLFFIYIRSLTHAHHRSSWSVLMHLVPYGLTWIYWMSLFVVYSEPELEVLFNETPDERLPVLFVLALLLEALAIPVYAVGSLWMLEQHRRSIADTFSYTEGIDLRWARALVYCAMALWLGIIIPELVAREPTWIADDRYVQIGYAVATPFVFYLGYFGLRQGHIMAMPSEPVSLQPASPSEPTAKYLKSGLKPTEAEAYVAALADYVSAEKPYLQNRLSIQDLAHALDIPARHLSQVINEQLQQSFYDYVNYHRVEEFKRRIADPRYKSYTVLAVALDCGFNSKSSFNRIFRKFEACTPTAYMERLNQEA